MRHATAADAADMVSREGDGPRARAFESTGLASWVLGNGIPPCAGTLREARLAAHAYTVLPADHPLRPSLRPDYLVSLRRHQEIKREIVPLLGAWRAAGLDVLLFKGFQLAEFVYPVPGARFHGDVDVLVRPEQLARAAEVAREIGWHEVGPPPAGPSFSHNAFTLVRAGGATMIDVHRWVVHSYLPWSGVQRRITESVWRASRTRMLDGVDVREPSPVDALLVGLVLQRCWSMDDWRLKPFDAFDFRCLSSTGPVDREALHARARALGCDRTLRIFLHRCDPEADRLELARPSAADRWRWNGAVFPERGLVGAPERGLAWLLGLPPRVLVGASYMPAVYRVRRALGRHTDLRRLLSALSPRSTRVRHARSREPGRVVAGVRWAMRLIGAGQHGACLVRSLAVYSILRRRGWPVEFVSGVRREGSKLVGHAWVEHAGVVLWELREPDNRLMFQENFRFPAEGRRLPMDGAGACSGSGSGAK